MRMESDQDKVAGVRNTHDEFVGLPQLKEEHKQQLAKFETWAAKKQFQEFGPQSHFDWFQFPITSKSSFGFKYSVFPGDVEELKEDQEFMCNYRRGIELILWAWGWDVKNKRLVENPGKWQKYPNYDIRLRKIGQSLLLFGESEYLDSANAFVKHLHTVTELNTRTEVRYGEESVWPFAKKGE